MMFKFAVPGLLPILAVILFLFPRFSSTSVHALEFKGISENHTYTILATGPIEADDAERLKAFLASTDHEGFRYRVMLNSSGGNLYGGLQLGRKIRELGFATEVVRFDTLENRFFPGECYSACALAFLGGERRRLEDGAILGFHQFSGGTANADAQVAFATAQSDAQSIATYILQYLIDMGISEELLIGMLLTPPDSFYAPPPDEMVSQNIVTSEVFTNFGFEPYRNGVISFSRLLSADVGRNVVDQVTIYCRSGRPHLLLSGEVNAGGLSPDFHASLDESFQGFQLTSPNFERVISDVESVEFRGGDTIRVEVALESGSSNLLMDGSFAGSISLPAAYGFIFAFRAKPAAGDRAKIQSSLTHCIS